MAFLPRTMTVLAWAFGGLMGALILAAVVFFYVGYHYEQGAPPIPALRAIELLNGCEAFTHLNDSTRQAVDVANISKGQGGIDAGSNLSFADVTWRWIPPSPQEQAHGVAKVTFRWETREGLGDWNFPESQYHVENFSEGEGRSNCGNSLR